MAEENDCTWFSLSRQPQEQPCDGSPTLKGRELDRWKAQFEPLLRHLRGKSVLVALSGGGMALPCHVSVLRVLDLLDVPISGIYGTSGGAVVGGLYAAGMAVEQIERMMRDIRDPDDLFGFASRHPAVRLAIGEIVRAIAGGSLDRAAIFSSSRVGAYIEESIVRYLGRSPLLSELKIPFSSVAFDTGAGRSGRDSEAMASKCVFSARTFPKVRLVDAVAASMAIPGTFPPKQIGEHFYIDGASVEDLPVATAFDDWRSSRRFFRKRTVVIASDLGYAGGALRKETLSDPMAMVRYASAIQARATTIYSLLHCHRPGKGFSVILVSPRTLTIRLWDVDKIPAALKTAYEQTVQQLSGSRFLDLTEEYIRGASSFLGLRSAAPPGSG
ncbi:MAG: patatin-like phospholipase family protein [Candidatus Eisenbacteria bacterium]|nr:patatin-like phospholipase family protein [Candidatus Eisenbacteria bacterium]